MVDENLMEWLCAQDRKLAQNLFSVAQQERLRAFVENPAKYAAAVVIQFCKHHEECQNLGKRFMKFLCKVSQSLVNDIIERPTNRNSHVEETVEYAFGHVCMCFEDSCVQLQQRLNSLRETCDPQIKDLIRRWDNEPHPIEKMLGPDHHQTVINPN